MSDDIRTPEEFCRFMSKMANKSKLLNSFKWLWERLTPEMRNVYCKYCKNYSSDSLVKQLINLINQVSKFNYKNDPIIEGSIVEAFFPYSDAPDLSINLDKQDIRGLHKTRPALVLKKFVIGKLILVVVAKITDANHANQCNFDIPISNPNACGLRKNSHICIYHLTTLDENKSIIGKYGCIQDQEKDSVINAWKNYMQINFDCSDAHLHSQEPA